MGLEGAHLRGSGRRGKGPEQLLKGPAAERGGGGWVEVGQPRDIDPSNESLAASVRMQTRWATKVHHRVLFRCQTPCRSPRLTGVVLVSACTFSCWLQFPDKLDHHSHQGACKGLKGRPAALGPAGMRCHMP